ncbi:uncharacterized protein MONBRDRAFT_15767, partial [Monosiga brevicollis MX1]
MTLTRLKNPGGIVDLKEVVGEGAYGKVHRGVLKNLKQIVAVKIIPIVPEEKEEIALELQVLAKFSSHHNIARFYGGYFQPVPREDKDGILRKQLWLVMQYCANGTATRLVKALRKPKPKHVIAYIMKEALNGLAYLHDNKIIHRDIKGGNILLTRGFRVKLVDFGVCAQLQHESSKRDTVIGTPYWMAPEVIMCDLSPPGTVHYDARADIWSLAITAIELADGEPPLSKMPAMKALHKIPSNKPPTLSSNHKWTKYFYEFLVVALKKNPTKRPNAEQLKSHPWLAKVEEEKSLETLRHLAEEYLPKPKEFKHREWFAEDDVRQNGEDDMRATDNLAKMRNFSEAAIVTTLQQRYAKDIIYTDIGDILVACNPFKSIDIYNRNFQEVFSASNQQRNPFPHVYNMAQATMRSLVHSGQNQCCIISGESGAGKTETAKYFVRQLLYTAAHHASGAFDATQWSSLEQRILASNPILEAFGNAKTIMNNNSSRFGKFLLIKFDTRHRLQGVSIAQYLLEKSRVVQQGPSERNFHVFYYLVSGNDITAERNALLLNTSLDFVYLGGTSTENLAALEDMGQDEAVKGYATLMSEMLALGFSGAELVEVKLILALILHLGNVSFGVVDGAESAEVFGLAALKHCSSLLGVELDVLSRALTKRVTVLRGEEMVKPLKPFQAEDNRDAAAKAIYGRLFAWIVTRINNTLLPDLEEEMREVGVLDIFGFENFRLNSFEQLCINVANEQLQYYFNQNVFAWELEELKSEGVNVANITFENNKPLLDMFLQRPHGLFAILDEESYFPQATDESLANKLHTNFANANKYYGAPKSSHTLEFSINHFASQVHYNLPGFLEKNRDRLSEGVERMLLECGIPLVRMFFRHEVGATGIMGSNWQADIDRSNATTVLRSLTPDKFRNQLRRKASMDRAALTPQAAPQHGKAKKAPTVSTHFRQSLTDLMSKMMQAQPHFVRCIKPNPRQIGDRFEEEFVLRQLQYTGVMQTVEIRKEGFPVRLDFDEFVRRYQVLGYRPGALLEESKAQLACVKILTQAGIEQNSQGASRSSVWELGKTKIFLKYFVTDRLAAQLEKHGEAAVSLQRAAKGFWARRNLKRLRLERD